MIRRHLIIGTTVPETLTTILNGQPKFLNLYLKVSLVTSPGKEFDFLDFEDVNNYSVPMRRGISFFNDLISLFRLIILFIKIKPDIVHSYTPKAGLLFMLAARICFVPVRIHTFTGLIWPTSFGCRRILLLNLDRLLCFCASHIIPEGRGVMNDLISGRVTRKRLEVIGFGNIAGVDTNYFSRHHKYINEISRSLKNNLGICRDDFTFIYVGRLNKDKGLSYLLAAFIQLPVSCHLLVVGAFDNEAPLDTDSKRILVMHPRVHWLGFQRDVRPALSASDVLVLPSLREGFPNVLLQAGSMGLPVIATNVSGSNEIVVQNSNGWLVPVEDIQALLSSMRKAINLSTDSLHCMGEKSRDLVCQRYERSVYWVHLLNYYKSVLAF
jgi:glycosyltransferase involved in cell wall biosynthesis